MTTIPPKVKAEILADPYYKTCARSDEGECQGRVTWEHAWIYAGKQVQEKWAIIPLCVFHHLGEGLDKGLNQFIALCRSDMYHLIKTMPKKDWKREFTYLSSLYEKI